MRHILICGEVGADSLENRRSSRRPWQKELYRVFWRNCPLRGAIDLLGRNLLYGVFCWIDMNQG